MRKLSCDWPIYLTVFAFGIFPGPGWHFLIMVINFESFNAKDLFEDIRLGVVATTMIWFIYGIACLLAKPLHDVSSEEPWKPSNDFHIDVSKGDKQNE